MVRKFIPSHPFRKNWSQILTQFSLSGESTNCPGVKSPLPVCIRESVLSLGLQFPAVKTLFRPQTCVPTRLHPCSWSPKQLLHLPSTVHAARQQAPRMARTRSLMVGVLLSSVRREWSSASSTDSFIPAVVNTLPGERGGFWGGCGIVESLCNTDAVFLLKKVPLPCSC